MSEIAAIRIRSAEENDLDVLQALFMASSMSNEGDRPVLTAHPEALQLSGAGVGEGRTRVAVEDGEILGFASYVIAEGVMDVEDLFVAPEHMRRGVARALIGDLVEIARSKGVHGLEVTANTHALAFYRSVGFVVDGERATQFSLAPHMVLSVA